MYLTSPEVQLILAYSWARPAILVAGKGRGGMFLFLLFLHFHFCSSFFCPSLSWRKDIEEIVKEMKERDREERGTGMKVKKQKK